jgi:hypothetical protein
MYTQIKVIKGIGMKKGFFVFVVSFIFVIQSLYCQKTGSIEQKKDEFLVSIICSGRNDDYGGNFLDRMCYFFRSVDRFQVKAEIIIVEWNPIEDRPRLSEVLNEWNALLKFNHPITVIEVSEENHKLFCRYYDQENTPFDFQEYPAKNIAFRHARGKYIIQTNPDNYYTNKVITKLQSIMESGFEGLCLGDPARFKLPQVSKFKSILGCNAIERKLHNLDKICTVFKGPAHFAYGDFMMFPRDLVLKSRGFPEHPAAIHHFEGAFITAFKKYNQGVSVILLPDVAPHHFSHDNSSCGGLKKDIKKIKFIELNKIKSISIGCPDPNPVNDENWGGNLLKLKKTYINN